MGYFGQKLRRGVCRANKQAALARPLPLPVWEWLAASPTPPRRMARWYVRIAVERVDPDSGEPEGIFTAAYRLARSTDLPETVQLKVRRTLRWFVRNLHVPKNVTREAIYWFRGDSTQCIEKVWNLVRLVRAEGAEPRMMVTVDPGRIVYRDALQVGAVPPKTGRRQWEGEAGPLSIVSGLYPLLLQGPKS